MFDYTMGLSVIAEDSDLGRSLLDLYSYVGFFVCFHKNCVLHLQKSKVPFCLLGAAIMINYNYFRDSLHWKAQCTENRTITGMISGSRVDWSKSS